MSPVVVAVLCGLLASCLHVGSIHGDFVFDDLPAVVRNPMIKPSADWKDILTTDYWGLDVKDPNSHKSYRPLTVASFKLNALLFGLEPTSFHIVNVVLHGLCTLLFTVLVSEMMSLSGKHKTKTGFSVKCSLTAGLLFAVHPIHTEAVSNVTGRAEILSGLLSILSVLWHMKVRRSNHSSVEVKTISALGCCLVAALSTLAKEGGIMAFPLLFAFEVIYSNILEKMFRMFESTTVDHPEAQELKEPKSHIPADYSLKIERSSFMYMALFVAGAGFTLWTRLQLQGDLPLWDFRDVMRSPFMDDKLASKEVEAGAQTIWLTRYYLAGRHAELLLAPYSLCPDRRQTVPLVESWEDPRLSLPFFVTMSIGLLLIGIYRSKQHRNILILGLAWLLLPFIPASNLFFQVGFVIAERVLYTPSVGFCILVGYAVVTIDESKSPTLRNLSRLLTLGLILLLGCKTVSRDFQWATKRALWESAVQECPLNYDANYNYASELYGSGGDPVRARQAVPYYQKAAEISDEREEAWHNLAVMYSLIGDAKKSAEAYNQAIARVENRENGKLLESGYQDFKRQEEKQSDHSKPALVARLALEYLKFGEDKEAEKLLAKYVPRHPDHLLLYFARGTLRHSQNNLEQAAQDFKRAEKLEKEAGASLPNPGEPGTTAYNLGAVLLLQGKYKDAIAAFRRSLEKEPKKVEALRLIAASYIQLKDGKSAVQAGEKAAAIIQNGGADKSGLVKRTLSDAWNQVAIENHEAKGNQAVKETIKLLEIAIAIDPTNMQPQENIKILSAIG